MGKPGPLQLSRRERQIMEAVYARGKASAAEIHRHLPDAPSRTAVRTILGILEEKGHLKHTKRGREFLYEPTEPRRRVGRSALRRVLETFFEGSIEKAVAAHLSDPASKATIDELERLSRLIREARREN
jgi:BlaI family penicillinase repressor